MSRTNKQKMNNQRAIDENYTKEQVIQWLRNGDRNQVRYKFSNIRKIWSQFTESQKLLICMFKGIGLFGDEKECWMATFNRLKDVPDFKFAAFRHPLGYFNGVDTAIALVNQGDNQTGIK